VAPPGNQAANGENKLQPVAMGGPGLLDYVRHERILYRVRVTAQEMRVWPLEAGLQEQASNHLKLLWSKATVVSVKEKSRHRIVAGVDHGDERKRTTDEVSKHKRRCQNWGSFLVPG